MATLTLYGRESSKYKFEEKNHYFIPVSDSSTTANTNYQVFYKITNLDVSAQNITTLILNTGICVTGGQGRTMEATVEATLYISENDAANHTNAITSVAQVIKTNDTGANFDFTFKNLSLTQTDSLYIAFSSHDRNTDYSLTLFEVWVEDDHMKLPTVRFIDSDSNWNSCSVNIYTKNANNTYEWKSYTPYIYYNGQWTPYTIQLGG